MGVQVNGQDTSVDVLAYALHRASGYRHGWGPPFDDAGEEFRVSEDHKEALRGRVRAMIAAVSEDGAGGVNASVEEILGKDYRIHSS